MLHEVLGFFVRIFANNLLKPVDSELARLFDDVVSSKLSFFEIRKWARASAPANYRVLATRLFGRPQ
jgi:hypothetical protein